MQVNFTTVQPKGKERVLTLTETGRPFNITLKQFDRLLHCGKVVWNKGAWRAYGSKIT